MIIDNSTFSPVPIKIFYSDHVELPLPDGHRFPMAKYRRTRELAAAANVGVLLPAQPVSDAELGLVHSAEYIQRVKQCQLTRKEARRIGFPNSPAMYQRACHSVGGTVCAARAAFEDGIAVHMAGGTHHAHYDWGQGYCVFNDVMVAARLLQRAQSAERIVVIDLDVHQGNGTAVLAQNDPRIFTFSMHGAKNFPFYKATSDLDIALPDQTEDAAYLDLLEESLWRVLMLAKADFAFYLAGADPWVHDRYGKMALTKMGLIQRDQMALGALRSAELPTVVCMGGGYARNVEDIAEIYFNTVKVAAGFYAEG